MICKLMLYFFDSCLDDNVYMEMHHLCFNFFVTFYLPWYRYLCLKFTNE